MVLRAEFRSSWCCYSRIIRECGSCGGYGWICERHVSWRRRWKSCRNGCRRVTGNACRRIRLRESTRLYSRSCCRIMWRGVNCRRCGCRLNWTRRGTGNGTSGRGSRRNFVMIESFSWFRRGSCRRRNNCRLNRGRRRNRRCGCRRSHGC